jgi:predicted  nucleic acid-binding Zn-ribbon protein
LKAEWEVRLGDGHTVQETLTLVYRLQTMDVEVLRLTAEIQESQEAVDAGRRNLESLEKQLAAYLKEIEDLGTSQRHLETELKETERLLTEGKKRQKELKHARDIQAYLAEMEFRRDEKDRFEEEILKSLEAQEQLKRKVTETENALAREREPFEVLAKEKEAQNEEREHKIAAINQERIDVEKSFPSDLLRTYNRLRASHKNGMVVARLLEGTCEACRMNLPPKTVTEVKKRQRIITCLFCQRWLFLPERTPKSMAVTESVGASGESAKR